MLLFFRDLYFININIICIKYYFVLIKVTFFDFFVVKNYAISTNTYTLRRKKVNLFYNNLGMRPLIIYFPLSLLMSCICIYSYGAFYN